MIGEAVVSLLRRSPRMGSAHKARRPGPRVGGADEEGVLVSQAKLKLEVDFFTVDIRTVSLGLKGRVYL